MIWENCVFGTPYYLSKFWPKETLYNKNSINFRIKFPMKVHRKYHVFIGKFTKRPLSGRSLIKTSYDFQAFVGWAQNFGSTRTIWSFSKTGHLAVLAPILIWAWSLAFGGVMCESESRFGFESGFRAFWTGFESGFGFRAKIPFNGCSFLQEGSQSLAESGQIPIYEKFNKSFKLQYYIPVCCLLLYMHCAHKTRWIPPLVRGAVSVPTLYCWYALQNMSDCPECNSSMRKMTTLLRKML